MLSAEDVRITQFLTDIKGFRIEVSRVSGIAKLAQDKGSEHARIALDHLSNHDHRGSGELFERLLRETLS